MNNPPTSSRRDFLKVAGSAAGGLVLGFVLPGTSPETRPRGPLL